MLCIPRTALPERGFFYLSPANQALMSLRKDLPGNILHQDGWLSLKSCSEISWLGKIHKNHTIAAKKLHIGLIATDNPKSSDMLL